MSDARPRGRSVSTQLCTPVCKVLWLFAVANLMPPADVRAVRAVLPSTPRRQDFKSHYILDIDIHK